METRGIDKDQLGVSQCLNPNHTRARCLRFWGNEGDFGADKGVEQGRFADVRPPNQGDKAATKWNIG